MPDRIPEFDLYAELEVSRSATKAAIEAAYRSLAKQTHPDATGKSDARFKRINIARQWLTDSELRRRYDGATWFLAKLDGSSSMADAPLRTGDGWSARRAGSRQAGAAGASASARDASARGAGAASRPARTWAPPSADAPEQARFGVNDAEVRQFLADLRSLNRSRAEEVKRGIGAADVSGRGEARRAAFAAGKQRRLREWLFAREAASIIVGTKLGDAPMTMHIAEAMADVAGAIALHDLLMTRDFELLLLPWTWRDERILEDHVGKTRRWAAAFPWQARTAASEPIAAPPPRPAAPAGTASQAGTASRAWTMTERVTPSAPSAAARASGGGLGRDQRRVLIGLSASTVVLAAALTLTALGSAFQPSAKTDGKNVPGATFQPVAGGSSAVPTQSSVASPSPLATPIVGIDPAQLADMQARASRTLQRLRTAAGIGDLATARSLLGDSAPGLRVSGLMRATFPEVNAIDIGISETEDGWLAIVGEDTMTSGDGKRWTFDYGERPLAAYRGTSEHNLYFLSGGRHDVYVTVTSVVVSRSFVKARLEWRFGSADAAAFSGYRLGVTSIGLGGRVYSIDPADEPLAKLGSLTTSATLKIPIHVRPASYGTIDVAVVSPGTNPSAIIATTIELAIL